jgi:diadenosine tetraphosphatase ApaH/serine/threonine PP2A family protein phosphatase
VEEYILDLPTARASFDAAAFSLCVVGHSHVPAVFVQNGEMVSVESLLPDRPLRLDPGQRYIVNVGSVGQPRDGDPRAAYLWLDEDARTAALIRLAYPLERTQQKILAVGLPPVLAERLAYGR